MAALTHLRAHPLLHRRSGKRRVGVQNKTRRGDLCVVDHRLRAPLRNLAHGLVGGGHHEIAAEQQVRFPGGDTHRKNVVLAPPDAHMRDHRAELLGQSGLIHGRAAFALDVRGHGDQRRDGQHAGAADAGHHRIPGPGVDIRQGGLGQGIEHQLTRVHRPGPAQGAADDGDKAWAESAIATVVLVARALIDAALATQRRFLGQHRQAVGLHGTVATALAHRVVNEQAPCGVGQRALFAAAAFFRGAGLLIDDHRGTAILAQFTL